jgi:hypothetical protein
MSRAAGKIFSDGTPPSHGSRRRVIRVPALLMALAVPLGGLTMLAPSASAAAVCLPTTYMQDGQPLTTAVLNTNEANANVDASGCDIGIFYNDNATHTVSNTSVFGAKYYGILTDGTGTTNITNNSSVYSIGDHPLSGTQHGIDIAYRNGAKGTVQGDQIYGYQKGGVLADGAATNGPATNVQVLDNVINGVGPTPLIAQNGVQFSRGAVGMIDNNFIEDNQYTGCTKQQQNAGTCTFFVSAGVLLYQVNQKLIDTKNNTYRDNDVNLLNAS